MIAYGYSVKEQNDPFVPVVEAAVNGFSESLEPGAFLVDVIPSRESTLPPFSHRWGMLTIPAIPTRDFYPSIRTLRIPFPFCLVFYLFYEQCNMCLTGSLGRDGKSRLSSTGSC